MKFASLGLLAGVFALSVSGQQYKAPLAADGHPDLQGFWANNNATPVERPKELADHPVLTDAEVKAMRQKAEELFTGKADAAFGDTLFVATWANVKGLKTGFISVDGETGDYGSEWNDHRVWDNRTSLITSPADGRIPPLTARAVRIQQESAAALRRLPENPEDRSFSERCISRGSPAIRAGYQSYFQIVQTANAAMILTEMFHDARVIRLDNSPHPPAAITGWLGDSRGRWEGNTLVIDTTNYRPRAFQNVSSEKLHTTERITRVDAETLHYEITVDDPGAWTKPWSLMIPLQRSGQPVYEYACHEGNLGMAGIMAGARADEAPTPQK